MARLRAVWAVIPVDIIEAIGRAPKVGPRRWLDLAKLLEIHPERVDRVRKMLTAVNISSDSNARLQQAVEAAEAKQTHVVKQSSQLDVKISSSTARGREFAKFIESRIPVLLAEFEKGEN